VHGAAASAAVREAAGSAVVEAGVRVADARAVNVRVNGRALRIS